MKEDRLKKAESISKKIIREYIFENLQELSETFGIVSVVDVKISSELSYLDVFVSSLRDLDALPKALAPHAHEIERILGKKIEFIKVPRVRFRWDETLKNSSEIYSLLDSLDITE